MHTNSTPEGAPDPFARFRRDHLRVLSEIDELERQALLGTVAASERALRPALALFEAQFATHMAAEDAILYPAIHAAFPACRSTLHALHTDHVELRLMLAALFTGLGAPPCAARDEQLQVILRDLVDLLRLHVHREESAVFDVASRALSGAEAGELARRIAAHVNLSSPGRNVPGSSKGSQP